MNPRKSCEICKTYFYEKNLEGNIFMASFPKNKERCKLWVKIVGNKALAELPLIQLKRKLICQNHFTPHDFNHNKNRLKRTSFPSQNFTRPPLDDTLLESFPKPFTKITGKL
ncbi:hypothetical protein ABMA28_000264 [Loxostege sticticalis]|uniref:THAP-type domain-containing protein n=1 Tax=Loxostege sticticalis TaxID=481309 RepID=A0ABD0TS59_LOXSC